LRFVDTHCHLNTAGEYPDVAEVLARARGAGVDRMLVVGIDEESTPEALRLAQEVDGVFAIVGIHPNSAKGFDAERQRHVEDWLAAPRVVGIGETGLDYHWDYAPVEDQRRAFIWHIELARTTGLPLVIHCRDAYDDCLAILEGHAFAWPNQEPGGAETATTEHGPPVIAYRGVFHCFGGEMAHAERALALGFHLGFDGPVTYKNADALREVVEACPLDRLLLETDCPYMPPTPHRGKRNEPSYIPLIAQAVADARGVPIEEIAAATTENAVALFQI